MSIVITEPTPQDIDELLQLYFTVYGKDYPLALGTDRHVMNELITDRQKAWWLVARDASRQDKIIGSTVFEIDLDHKIGKLSGVIVLPDYRKQGLANRMIAHGCKDLLSASGPLNSIYTTTRTLSLGPQIMCLKEGFVALGIFPNAHKLAHNETMTLLGKFKAGILEKRAPIPSLPEKLQSLLTVAKRQLRLPDDPIAIPAQAPAVEMRQHQHQFEFVYAPQFVYRRFLEAFPEASRRFYPFHKPNLLMTAVDAQIEIYAYLSKADQYCTLHAATVPITTLANRLAGLMDQMTGMGICYMETIVRADRPVALQAFLDFQFVPSAFYPAMRETGGRMIDYVVMSRTLQPLNFRGMAVDQSFKPYVDQYIALWKQMHLDVLEIYHGGTAV